VTITDSQLARLEVLKTKFLIEAKSYLDGSAAASSSEQISILTKLGARCMVNADELGDIIRAIKTNESLPHAD